MIIIAVVLLSWHSHCESSPISSNECILSARWPPTLKPSLLTWAMSHGYEFASKLLVSTSTIVIYYYYSSRKLTLILPFCRG